MSHFSQIKTSLKDVKILEKTLKDMSFTCIIGKSCIQENDGKIENVDILVKKNNQNIMGFLWNGQEYLLVIDEQVWNRSSSVNNLVEKILQQYALNSILAESNCQGFKQINRKVMQDGSIKLIVQKWN
uniref:Uncharacterized protein ycf35 n=1 Tax=Melanthalia intermedia TaxID=172989 RepID=A0A345UAG1_9FLOR|nr:hypothetical protein [Melanthalia intermedia]AXI97447.1 hypothetical protein [Melanthalia intermedia]